MTKPMSNKPESYESCPLCMSKSADILVKDHRERLSVKCSSCGYFVITVSAMSFGERNQDLRIRRTWKPLLGHWLANRAPDAPAPDISVDLFKRVLQERRLPKAQEQADNLIIWLGGQLALPEDTFPFKYEALAMRIGSALDGVDYVLQHLAKHGLITQSGFGWPGGEEIQDELGLTFDGWRKYDDLKRLGVENKVAFMAMQYSDSTHDRVYRQCFKKAVEATGFELQRLDEVLGAGLIDNQMRAEIRKARLVLADLTNDNNGAYWEAGYAEGLGKPVIYLCEKSHFEKFKTHFDTNHHTTIPWDEKDLEAAAEALKVTIRATLPLEAELND